MQKRFGEFTDEMRPDEIPGGFPRGDLLQHLRFAVTVASLTFRVQGVSSRAEYRSAGHPRVFTLSQPSSLT